MKIIAAVLLVSLSVGFVASNTRTSRSSTEEPLSTETQHDSTRTVSTPSRAILRNKSTTHTSQTADAKTTLDPHEDPLLLGDPKSFLSPKDMLMQEIQTLDEDVSNAKNEDFIDIPKAQGKKIGLPGAKKNVTTDAGAFKKLLDAEKGASDDLTEEEENDGQDDYEDEEDELDDDELVLTGCPDHCKCAGEYAAATTATCNKFVDEQTFGTDIAHLRIENAPPITLGPHAFRSRGLQHLESITITDTVITELNQTAFEGVAYLFAVNLTGNGLQEVPSNLFQTNAQVTLLSISRNPLKHSQDPKSSKHGLFDTPSVTEFDYSHNDLTKLKRNAFAKMPNLLYINLRSNKLKEIDSAAFNSLESLIEVDLSKNLLNEIPADMFSDTEVESLNVAENNLTTLSTIHAPELRQLYASNNKIRIIPRDGLLAVPLLEHLVLLSNELRWIHPSAFSDLEMLSFVDLSNNKLTSLKENHFIGNAKLQILLLNDNPGLETLPAFRLLNDDDDFSIYRFECTNCGLHTLHEDTFKHMPALQSLNLSKNRLTGLSNGLLRNVGALRVLDLSDNIISNLEGNMFNGANSLVKLSLAGNPLKSLQVSPFLSTPNLSKLDASRCALQRIWREARVPLESLQFLSVRENLLKRVTIEELQATPKIAGLNLAHNPFECDDEFREAVQWLTDRRISPMEPFRYLNDYVNEDNYQDNEGISEWIDLAAVVCRHENDGPPSRHIPFMMHKMKKVLAELDFQDPATFFDKQNDEQLRNLWNNRGMQTDEALEETWTTQDQEYEDFATEESSDYHPWYTSAVWPVATIVIITVMLVFLAIHVAFYLAKRRGGGPVIRPPMILRGGLIDNKNCGLVYKPLQEEIATPHMPKRGSFYSSSTFHYDKIVPESV